MKVLWTAFTWLIYLILGALTLSLAGGLATLAVTVGAVLLVGGAVVFLGALVVFGVKEYRNPTIGPPPKDKQ